MEQYNQPKVLPETSKDTTQVQIELNPQQLYDAAYLDITKGSYDLAISSFSEYLKYFPDTQLSDNAQYWIAECYYAKNDYQKAAVEFKKVVSNFPKGDKVPAALYKLGLCFKKMENKSQAKKTFQELVQKYPQSEEAALAKERLAELKK
jgi:tol-pal system protein YbgF